MPKKQDTRDHYLKDKKPKIRYANTRLMLAWYTILPPMAIVSMHKSRISHTIHYRSSTYWFEVEVDFSKFTVVNKIIKGESKFKKKKISSDLMLAHDNKWILTNIRGLLRVLRHYYKGSNFNKDFVVKIV